MRRGMQVRGERRDLVAQVLDAVGHPVRNHVFGRHLPSSHRRPATAPAVARLARRVRVAPR